MKKTYRTTRINDTEFNLLALPGTNFFKFEIVNMYGSAVEKIYKQKTGKNVYGLSHLVEHLSFRATKDYSTAELLELIKNEGNYNASTDFTRVNYWFKTSMDRSFLGIRLVMNFAMNDLRRISQEEFEIEKKVVYNEAKRYADDDQTMFYFNAYPKLCKRDSEDNIIGLPETVETFTLEDAIILKDIFLQNTDVKYNITYDPEILTEKQIIDEIQNELLRFKHQPTTEGISKREYLDSFNYPEKGEFKIQNESTQILTAINLDILGELNKSVQDAGNAYLLHYAKGTSLNDIIREQNGLTYSISFETTNEGYCNFTFFGCDVTKGSEELLIQLLEKSIKESANNFDIDAYNNYMRTRKLKRTLNLLDLNSYEFWHQTATWNTEIFCDLENTNIDLDKCYDEIDTKYCTYKNIKAYIDIINSLIRNKNYGIVQNIEKEF